MAEGTPGDLAASLGADVIRVRGSGDQAHFVSHVAALPFVARVETDPEAAMVLVYVDSGSRRLVEVVGLASGNGFVVEDVTVSRPGLGDVFLHHTGRALRD